MRGAADRLETAPRAAALLTLFAALIPAATVAAGEATVERGDLVLTFERHARVEPSRKRPVRYEPEVFNGRL